MSIPLEGGNKSVVVYCSQPVINAHKGAHGKQTGTLEQPSTGVLKHSCEGQKSDGMHSAQNSPRIPEGHSSKAVTSLGNALKTDVSNLVAQTNISKVKTTFEELFKKSDISPQAKVVYSDASNILSEVSKCKDFSATNIQEAIKIGLERVATTTGLKYTVSFFDFTKDERSQTGQDPLANDQDCINAGINLELDQLGTDKAVKNEQNTKITYINFTTKVTKDSVDTYDVEFSDNTKKSFKIHCPKDFPIANYTDQLCAEASTYSGDITIKKAEPGSVFVRVFGKGQSPLRPCWCNAGDINSAVTNAKDLYDKLGVNFKWNGDGNMAVLVVPNDIEIYFAEGTIASQIGNYKETNVENGEIIIKDRFFIFQGGGTQTNILAENVSQGYRTFANQIGKEIWQKIMFVFHNDGIINIQELLKSPAQNSQKSEQK